MDKLAFLDGDTPVETPTVTPEAAPAPEAAAVTEPVAEAPKGPERGPDGKFVAKATEAAPAAEPAPVAAPEAPAVTPAPVAAAEPDELTRLRTDNERLQNTNQGLNKALTSERAQRRQAFASAAPDPEQDPEGHEAFESQQAELNFKWSFHALGLVHGNDKALEVAAWAGEMSQTDPHFYQRALTSPDPAGFAYEAYEDAQAMKMLRDPSFRQRFAAFQTSAASPATPVPAVTVAPPPSPAAPPRSLAAAPNAGGAKPGAIPVGPGVAFANVFKE